MKKYILLFLFTCLSFCLFGQTNKGKDLVFRVKTEKTTVKILPEVAPLDTGSSHAIVIRINPGGRKIGKVTFKGGTIVGSDSTYTLTAGNGTEGILSIYEKTATGNKLITNKVYPFKKVIVRKAPKASSNWHFCAPGDGHHATGIRAGNKNKKR